MLSDDAHTDEPRAFGERVFSARIFKSVNLPNRIQTIE